MDKVVVGIVARPHGVRGELRVNLHDPASSTLYDVRRVFVGDAEATIDSVRPTNGALLVKFVGIDDRDAADALRGREVAVRRADIRLRRDEFLVADLVGCEVTTAAGAPLGRIASIIHGAQDLLVIHDDRVERLLPFVPVFLVSVDLAARRVVVDPPDELPEEPLRRR
jgi:16S rRNA processing protein RimM